MPAADSAPRFSRADLLLLLTVCVWGINFSVVKGSISGPGAPFSPIAFNGLRFIIAAITLLAILRQTDDALPASRRDWLAVLGLGLLGNSLYQLLFIMGLNQTSPASSALIVATTPVTVALIGAALRIERLTALAWLGIGLSLAGIVVVVLGGASGVSGNPGELPLIGNLLILGSTTVWAVYTTLAAPLLKRYSATTVTSLALATGGMPLILIALPELGRLNWRAVPITGWTGVAYSGIFALAAAYTLWGHGVKQLGGARTAVYANLVPIVAAVVAWIARGDALTVYHLIGAAIILTGIQLTRIGRQPRVDPILAEG